MSHAVSDEYYDLYCETFPRARKDRSCDACAETIPKGDRYARVAIVYEETRTVVRCLRCQKIHEHLRALDPGEMWPAELLDCGEEYKKHWGNEPPPEVAALAFATREEMQVRLREEMLAIAPIGD